MIQDIRTHSTHYAILAGFLTLMLFAFLKFAGNEALEASILLITGMGYVLWGIGHHYLNRDISAKIVAEYVLMAILAITILMTALLSR